MGTSNLPDKNRLEIQMRERIAELEKANKELRAENMALNRNITKCKRADEASGQNEQFFGLKFENNFSLPRKAENLELVEIIDIQAVQSIMDDFYKFAHITMALLDLKGNVLIGVGWQDICTKFHRVHPETCKHCIESDTQLSAGVPPGEFKLYKCKNNLWDIVTPIIVDGQHIGNIFSGQFFFDDEPVDYELFRAQARKYGFNEQQYIAALEKVQRLSRETVENSMSFFMKLANMLSQLSHSNIKLAQSLEERDTLVNKLEKKSEDFDRAQAVGNIGSWRLNIHKNELTWSDENYHIFGIPKGTPLTYETFLSTVHPDDREYVDKEWKASLKGKPHDIEHRITVDGKIKWVREKAYLEFDKDGAVVSNFGITQDITERRQAEHQLSNELARATGLYELYTRSSNLSDRELYDFALNQAVKITDSTIGFFHIVSEDEKEIILTTWNQEALRSCTAGNEGHYPIEKAGNWVDCVRLKRPVVYNDFPSSPNQKGLPAGHATVKRFMSVPITENGKVRIIFGVGNKTDEYDDRDVMQIQLVANELHKIMKLRRIENEVRESEAFLRDIMENVSDAIFVKDREARMILANPAYYRLMDKSPEEVLNKTAADFHPPEIAKKLAEDDKRVMETGKGTTLEERIFTSHGWRILHTVKAPYYDGQGNIIGLIGAARDITERKMLEEQTRQRVEELETLMDVAPVAIFIGHDPKCHNITGNQMANTLYEAKLGENVSPNVSHLRRLFHKGIELTANELPMQKAAIKDIDVRYEELDVLLPSGEWLGLLGSASPLHDAEGNVRGSVGAFMDITEIKKAEAKLEETLENLENLVKERTTELEEAYESLKESEKGLAEAQRMSHIGNWDWNLVTNELYYSDELYRIFGLSPQERYVSFDEILTYIHPKDRDYVTNSVIEALNGKIYNAIDFRIITADEKDRIIHTQGEVIFDEKSIPIRMRGIFQDITERKKAEEKIRILADAVESSNDAIITESLDGNITSWNKTAEHIYGYSAEEILGKNISILEPENVKGDIKKIIEKVKQGEKIQHYKTLRQKKDGTIINVSITYSPIFDASGKLISISAIVRDITEQVNAEKLLAKAEEARKKEIHHRIKNNLQVISSLLDLQAEKFRSRECSENVEVLNAFRESQDRVMSIALIHKELHEGRGTDKLNFSPYLKRLAENLFQTYRLGNLDISLNLDVEENIFFDMDIAVPLGMIVNELVSNSLKYAFPDKKAGEIQIKLFSEEATSEMKTRGELFEKGKRYTLIISDNGIGIPKEINLENTKTLGLQLVNILVEQLDGEVELKRDKGTGFTISFSIVKEIEN